MRRLITGFISVFLAFLPVYAEESPSPTPEETAQEGAQETTTAEEEEEKKLIDISTDYAVLIDADSGKVLFDSHADTQRDPASLTKIMTVYVAMQSVSESQQITMSSEAFQTYDHNQGVLWIQEGETLSALDCEYATMLASANDTAAMLAEAAALSQEGFVQRMNAEAESMKLANTKFDNIFGYTGEGNRSTAYDIAMITRQAIRNESFRKIFGASGYSISPTNKQPQSRAIAQDCELLRSGQYAYEDITGGKIGSTASGGFVLAASAKRGATSLIAVVLQEETADSAYRDIVKIFEYGFQNAQTVTITPADIGTKTVEVMKDGKHVADVTFSADSSFSVLMPKEMDPDGLTSEIVVMNEKASEPERISAEVHFLMNGDLIGTAPASKKIQTVEAEPGIVEKTGGFRGIFDLFCIAVLVGVLLLPPAIRLFLSLAPPKE